MSSISIGTYMIIWDESSKKCMMQVPPVLYLASDLPFVKCEHVEIQVLIVMEDCHTSHMHVNERKKGLKKDNVFLQLLLHRKSKC